MTFHPARKILNNSCKRWNRIEKCWISNFYNHVRIDW